MRVATDSPSSTYEQTYAANRHLRYLYRIEQLNETVSNSMCPKRQIARRAHSIPISKFQLPKNKNIYWLRIAKAFKPKSELFRMFVFRDVVPFIYFHFENRWQELIASAFICATAVCSRSQRIQEKKYRKKCADTEEYQSEVRGIECFIASKYLQFSGSDASTNILIYSLIEIGCAHQQQRQQQQNVISFERK